MIQRMDLGSPHAAILRRADADALKVLVGRNTPATGREIARIAGAPHVSVARSLARLVEQGVVDRSDAGNSSLFMLNRDHLAASALEELVRLRPRLLNRFREELAGWDPPAVALYMYGSGARGDGDTKSDIDLLIVRPARVASVNKGWQAQVDHLRSQAERWTGNHASILEYDEADARSLRKHSPSFAVEFVRDAIPITGPTIARLLAP